MDNDQDALSDLEFLESLMELYEITRFDTVGKLLDILEEADAVVEDEDEDEND